MRTHISLVLKLWALLKPFHKYFYVQLFFITILQLLIILIAFINGAVLTNIVSAHWNMVALLFLAFLLAHQVDSLFSFLRQRNSIHHLDQSIYQYLQEYSMHKILMLTPEQHTEDHSAIKLSIIGKGEVAVQNIIGRIIDTIIPITTLLVITIVTLLLLHPTLGILSILVFVIIFFWAYFFQKNHYPYVTKNRDNWNAQQKERTEAFEHLNLVKLLAKENYFIKKFLAKRQEAVAHNTITAMRNEKNSFFKNSFTDLATISTLALAVYLYSLGAFAIGIVYTVFSLVNRIYWNISSLSNVMRQLPQSYADVQKYLAIIEKEPSFKEGGHTKEPLQGDIIFTKTSFKYPKAEGFLFENLTFTLPHGLTTAIVGESGGGKSTITRLLMRAYDYDGSITIGGIELRAFDIHHLRESIGYVEQHVDLLDETVGENILFGVKEKERGLAQGRLENVAKLARIDQFYHRLGEKKFDTLVGERGIKLSGGERQRIGIARAIIKNPEILIFDEATSSLDTENEKYVMDAIKDVSKGKTTIIIAHRLSTVKDADKIIVMDKGKVVGEGTHDELLANNAVYQNLVAHQV